MSQPTPSELALLRNRDKRTQLYLSIYQPKVVFAAQVNNVNISIGETYIDYDTVSSGAYFNIKPGMTMYIGSTPGGTNYGRIRVRFAGSDYIMVAENSDINWKDNLYLTIKDFHEVWPIYQTLQQVGNTPDTDVILVYKDGDISYTGQNSNPGSLISMGSHQAIWLESGSAQLYWSASGTVNTNGDTNSYLWSFEGGTPTGSVLQNPGLIEYVTAGHYVTQLDVTSSSGTVDTSYRYVSVYDDANQPIIEWGMDDLKGSRSEGAYTSTIWVRQPVNGVVEGALVVIFSKSYYGSTPYSFVNNIEFVGYILNDSITYDYQQSKVEFSVGSVTEVMKECEGPGLSLTSVIVEPDTWSDMQDVTIQKAIWWFLRWHSTVMNLADVRYIGTNFYIYAFESDNGTLYEVLSTFIQSTVLGSVVSNRQGQIFCEIDPSAIHNTPTDMSLGMAIDRQDWMGEPNIREATRPEISYLEIGGYSYEPGASTGTNTPYLACAPGVVPSYFGKMEEVQGLALDSGSATSDQAYLNTLAGDYLAYRNARYPETGISMAGNYGNIELVPSERYLLTVEAQDSQSRVEVNNLPVHPIELTWKFVPEKNFLSVDATFHELTVGYSGTTLDIPVNTIDNDIYIPPYVVPPFFPQTGIIPWIPPIIPPDIPPDDDCTTGPFHPNSYLTYPELSTLDNTHLSTYVWFPCKVQCAQYSPPLNPQVLSYLEVFYTAHGTTGDYLTTAELVSSTKGIIKSDNFQINYPGHLDTYQRNSYWVDWDVWIPVAGFKINLKPYSEYLSGKIACTVDSYSGATEITEGLDPSFRLPWASYGWITWNTGGTCPPGTQIYPTGGYGCFYSSMTLYRGGVKVYSGGGCGINPSHVAFDQIYWKDNYIADIIFPFTVLSPHTPYTPGDIQITKVIIHNVCPL